MKMVLGLAVVLQTAGVFAKSNDDVITVTSVQGKNIELVVREATQVSLYDAQSNLIHSEMTSAAPVRKKYDLNALPSGTYYLQTASESANARYEIVINNSAAVIANSEVAEVVKPTVLLKDNHVLVSILNFRQTPVSVSIQEKDGSEIYANDFASGTNFFRKFDISSFPAGTYVFNFNYGDRHFSQSVTKK